MRPGVTVVARSTGTEPGARHTAPRRPVTRPTALATRARRVAGRWPAAGAETAARVAVRSVRTAAAVAPDAAPVHLHHPFQRVVEVPGVLIFCVSVVPWPLAPEYTGHSCA